MKYIEFLETGLTLEGAVWRTGAVLATESSVADLSSEDQLSRFGVVHFRTISAGDYKRLAGATVPVLGHPNMAARLGLDEAPVLEGLPALLTAIEGPPPAPTDTFTPPTTPTTTTTTQAPEIVAEPFPGYADMDDEKTLEALLELDDAALNAFVAYETAHRNRSEILEAVSEVPATAPQEPATVSTGAPAEGASPAKSPAPKAPKGRG